MQSQSSQATKAHYNIGILTGKLMVHAQGEIYSSSKGVTCEDRWNTKRKMDEKNPIILALHIL